MWPDGAGDDDAPPMASAVRASPRSQVWAVGVVALMPRQVYRCRRQFEREGEHDQAEVGDRGPRGGFGDADQEIGAARELQRGRFRGRGRHHAAGEVEPREGVPLTAVSLYESREQLPNAFNRRPACCAGPRSARAASGTALNK